jgi:hypothetical protein
MTMTTRALLCGLLLALPAARAAEQPQPKADIPASGPDGWISLFNGKDLTGWEFLPGYWSVTDGVIQGAQMKENSKQTNLILASSKDHPEKFANFELRYSYRWITPTGNSGMQIRGKIDRPQAFHVGGYQADIDPNNQHTGTFYDEGGVAGGRGVMSKRGFRTTWDDKNQRSDLPLDKKDAEIKAAIKPVGEWNDAVIVADGNRITYAINGQTTTELVDQSPKACKDGVIGLQMHGGCTMTLQCKDVRIRFLDAK